MSRIGNLPVSIPAKVTVTIDGQNIKVKGPKGELEMDVHPRIKVEQEESNLVCKRPNDEKQSKALHGLTRALVANMVTGVSDGFRRSLIIEGVGYTSEMRGKDLVLKLGYSHEIVMPAPPDTAFVVEDRGRLIHVDGIDKQVVGETAALIRKKRPPEPYLGKGVRYSDERILRKAGKSGK
ncbi:MAG: 50S ribosomal protein L6 [Chloroflexi bacterium]|nr:50S ribosomal protein L6 [Chloroflexota bacterium]